MTNTRSIESLSKWAEWLDAKVAYQAWATVGDGSYYTITRDVAGGPFTARYRGIAIHPAGRLRDARAAARRHNGGDLEWVDVAQRRALGF